MKQWSNNTEVVFLIPIQDGPFWGLLTDGGIKRSPP